MTPEVRQEIRKLRREMCSMAERYKGVNTQSCINCESPCEPGRECMRLLGLKAASPPKISDVFEPLTYSRGRRTQKVLASINRGRK